MSIEEGLPTENKNSLRSSISPRLPDHHSKLKLCSVVPEDGKPAVTLSPISVAEQASHDQARKSMHISGAD